jgi:WD40 repeat protein
MSGALRPLPGYHLKQVNIARWNSDGLYLGSSSSDKQVKIGQLEGSGTLRQVQTIPMITNVTQIVWHPTETGRFCVAGDDKAIELWDVRASRATSKIQTLSSNLNVSWSPDGKYLAVGNSVAMTDNVIVVDIGQSKWFKRAKFGFEVNELSWTANSSHLLAATGEGTIDVLNADLENSASPDMSLVGSFTAHTSNCFALKVDRDFQRMAVGSADHNVSLWDLGDLVCHHTHSFDAPVRYLSFSGDGQRLAVVPEGSSVHILDSNSADPIRKVECEKTVTALCWHPKSPLLAVGVADVVTKATTTLPSFLKFVSLPANL